MAVKIRLSRFGSNKKPFYRIIAADSRSPRDGRFIEILGTYDSTKNPAEVNIKIDKLVHWLNKGAQPTDTVKSLLKKNNISKNNSSNKDVNKVTVNEKWSSK